MRYSSRHLISRAPEPVREQLRALLVAEVERGTFLRGARLPSERQLAQTFGTSRTTVRQAVDSLIKEGMLVRSAGRGTFVADAGGGEAPQSSRLPGSNGTLTFVISEEIFEFVQAGYNRILLGAQKECQQRGYRLLFHALADDTPLEEAGIAGYIVVGGAPRRYLDRLKTAGAPFVLVDLLLDDRSASVGFDYAGGMRQAITYLHGLGHRDIGFIGFPNSEKYVAFWQMLAALGLRYEPRWVTFLELPELQASGLAGYRAMQRILVGDQLPTAMIATNDLVALGIMDALAVAGIEVPKRMSVMGFDDLGADTDRPVSTMRVDSAEAGRLAVRTLLEQIRSGTPNQNRVTVPTELIVRASTAAADHTGEGCSR